jgi:hypothetical protein
MTAGSTSLIEHLLDMQLKMLPLLFPLRDRLNACCRHLHGSAVGSRCHLRDICQTLSVLDQHDITTYR